MAGLIVALALVPEVVAFAFVVGIDPLTALHSSVIIGLAIVIFKAQLAEFKADDKLD